MLPPSALFTVDSFPLNQIEQNFLNNDFFGPALQLTLAFLFLFSPLSLQKNTKIKQTFGAAQSANSAGLPNLPECIEFNVEIRPPKPGTKTAAAHTADQKGGASYSYQFLSVKLKHKIRDGLEVGWPYFLWPRANGSNFWRVSYLRDSYLSSEKIAYCTK